MEVWSKERKEIRRQWRYVRKVCGIKSPTNGQTNRFRQLRPKSRNLTIIKRGLIIRRRVNGRGIKTTIRKGRIKDGRWRQSRIIGNFWQKEKVKEQRIEVRKFHQYRRGRFRRLKKVLRPERRPEKATLCQRLSRNTKKGHFGIRRSSKIPGSRQVQQDQARQHGLQGLREGKRVLFGPRVSLSTVPGRNPLHFALDWKPKIKGAPRLFQESSVDPLDDSRRYPIDWSKVKSQNNDPRLFHPVHRWVDWRLKSCRCNRRSKLQELIAPDGLKRRCCQSQHQVFVILYLIYFSNLMNC